MSGKLPIPRLRREGWDNRGRRTARACDSCRQRKIKCDGKRPLCSHCGALGFNICIYSETKASQQRKKLDIAQRRIESYEELLRDIAKEFEGPVAKKVTMALSGSEHEEYKRPHNRSSRASSSSVGSLHAIEVVDEDLNRSEKSRATGYMGKNSEVSWMQCLDSEASKWNDETGSTGRPEHHQFPIDRSIASMNYHLDYQTVPNPTGTDAIILPPKPLADHLFQIYLDKVHVSLPFIRRDLFIDQYFHCFSGRQINPGGKWLAILNLIFAIASAYCRLSGQAVQQAHDENLFLERAKMLEMSDSILYGSNDLQQVQAEGLLSLYFLVISQINRAWKMVGIAARSGIALGLNLQKRVIPFDMKSNESRKQLWWSIFRLENHLSVMTGRVSCLGGVSYSTFPPLLGPILESATSSLDHYACKHRWTIDLEKKKMESQRKYLKSLPPTSSLYFFYAMDLSLIAHAITNEVYAIDGSHSGWSRVEGRIDTYMKKMDYWISTLQPSFRFQDHPSNEIPNSILAFRIALGLNYYSTCILLYRPCLSSHAAGRKVGLPTCHSRFATTSARSCVRASLAVMDLLPDQPDLAWPYELLQWWDILHVLTQATVILLLDISIDPIPMMPCGNTDPVERVGSTWSRAKKGLSWLHCLGMTSEAARRAFQFLSSCVRRIAPNKGLDLKDIPSSFGSLQTSVDPNFPWFRDYPEKNVVTPNRDRGSSSTELPNLLSNSEICNDMSPWDDQPFLSGFSNASVLLDADIDIPKFVSYPGAHIDDLLLSIISP